MARGRATTAQPREHRAPYELVRWVAENGRLPVVTFTAGGIATPADASLVMQRGADGVFVGSGIFKSGDPETRAKAIVEATTHFDDPKAPRGLDRARPADGRHLRDLAPGRGTARSSRLVARPAWRGRRGSGCSPARGLPRARAGPLDASVPRSSSAPAGGRGRASTASSSRAASRSILRLARLYGLDEAIRAYAGAILGTCAGMILLDSEHLGLADLEVDRNAYGRQVKSFEADVGPRRGGEASNT